MLDWLGPVNTDFEEVFEQEAKSPLRNARSRLAISMQTSGVSTCDGSLCPMLFGVSLYNVFSKSTISVHPVIGANFQETQFPKEEDHKGASPYGCFC